MKLEYNVRQLLAVAAIGLGFMLPSSLARADSEDMTDWGAQWAQWAFSIPLAVNPILGSDSDNPTYANAGKCVIGQHGSVWFLAGTFGVEPARRTCSVPEDASLFFPVVNAVQISAPGVCGEVAQSAKQLRTNSAAFIAGVTSYSVRLDGRAIRDIQHLKSPVFEVALPKDNVFGAACPPDNVPARIYSPAVDEGFYVLLEPLKTGPHTLLIRAENPAQNFTLNVTFNLNVVPVSQK